MKNFLIIYLLFCSRKRYFSGEARQDDSKVTPGAVVQTEEQHNMSPHLVRYWNRIFVFLYFVEVTTKQHNKYMFSFAIRSLPDSLDLI